MKWKIPPAVVLFVFGLLMYLLAEFLPFGYFDFFGRHYLAIAFVVFAIVVVTIALYQFYTAKTTIDPTRPDTTNKLVVSGIYAYTRNPMYLGLLLILLAWGLWLGNAFNTLLAAAFVAYMNRFQIAREEQALNEIFGKDFKQYCLLVRRWF
ncbi:isoprenylcysteine carboxylmethyltransferase family protein [Pricia sp. S334]|uniref:Isoprenylcysteine carboxylmethyltransferase family protein n=1 Tax=Pricia mediterranea TaxID=3076079 RepID=A0ABU3L996_9FLAO|nr:isoprenylcysteine carboxylmethyltransferase family protein [Pricia sp. S334]MDT7830299.1 isoprenylcysteine carboxylmethyltransferase family protein [Pricia sp. S334]